MQKTLILIPCYNESQRINTLVFDDFLSLNSNISLLFVDDGSTDNTKEILERLSESHLNAMFISFSENAGKAEAIRKSILQSNVISQFQYVGYFDADLSTSLSYINKFLTVFSENPELLFVTGSRIRKLGSEVQRNFIRHFFGRIVATIASYILSLPVYDTQCGAKIFKSEIVNEVFSNPFISKWLFDIEIFARLGIKYSTHALLNHVYEYPLEKWIDDGDSRIKLKDFLRVPMDLFKIYKSYHKKIKHSN